MNMSDGTVVVITGAGSGIGRALTLACAHRGCAVAAIDKDRERLEALLDIVRTAPVTTHHTDVGIAADVTAVAQRIHAQHGHVDVLINCAGVSVAAPFAELPLADFQWLMQTNFWGVVHTCQAFLPLLHAAPTAVVANVLSPFAVIGFPTKTAYCASKFAVRGFTKALRTELIGSGISVTNVYPGPVATRLIRDGRVWQEAARAAEEAFMERRGLPVSRVVSRTIRGIERKRSRVRIGVMVRLLDWLVRVAPASSDKMLGWRREHLAHMRGAAT